MLQKCNTWSLETAAICRFDGCLALISAEACRVVDLISGFETTVLCWLMVYKCVVVCIVQRPLIRLCSFVWARHLPKSVAKHCDVCVVGATSLSPFQYLCSKWAEDCYVSRFIHRMPPYLCATSPLNGVTAQFRRFLLWIVMRCSQGETYRQ